ncbi:hypothetical protein MUA04_09145 [Enterobacteriaceae bacterium H11S18]|uniref:hypothetical protein n=1 Tax=Dryocola clanedunensis TaxID=2925396 RepID=UPI0022F099D2|nr:hypothetical protein [Dryocola clanedunensis]MCT4704373.1 hypothetical protein [Dryocola clanedunensis]MCT4710354.1 hypothetical protein [Dryocola clanedunensis]
MKKITSLFCTCTLLIASCAALAQNPAQSTSSQAEQKEQLKNPGHISDDCRAQENKNSKACLSGHEMREEHKTNEKMIQKGGTTDEVMQQDATKTE